MIQDYDGTAVFSDHLEAFLGTIGKLYVDEIYPNPVLNGRATASITQKNGEPIDAALFDINGKKLDPSLLLVNRSGSRIEIEARTGELVSGIYFFRIRSRGQNVNRKFVVLN